MRASHFGTFDKDKGLKPLVLGLVKLDRAKVRCSQQNSIAMQESATALLLILRVLVLNEQNIVDLAYQLPYEPYELEAQKIIFNLLNISKIP